MKHKFQDYATSTISCTIENMHENSCLLLVKISSRAIHSIYTYLLKSQQKIVDAPGFQRGTVPLQYIEDNFQSDLIEHIKEFILNYLIVNYVLYQIRTQKIRLAGEPRIKDIYINPHTDGSFVFHIPIFDVIPIKEWKYFPFKAPKRKNYKDLDRQVIQFVNDEKQHFKNCKRTTIETGDWVHFSLSIMDDQTACLLDHASHYWAKIGDEEVDRPFRDIFLNKKIGDTFFSSDPILQEYFTEHLYAHYLFRINIIDILYHNYFCFDQFKKQFKVKTNRELHQKMIEVFSYRNDLSQRRAMVEESLKLMLSKHRFNIPESLITSQQEIVLSHVHRNPDYHVYRAQKDFKARIQQLAEKQVKEKIFIDQFAYFENISIVNADLKAYLNLTNRPRTKEFIYFDMPITKIEGKEIPISCEELKQICLREKSLNHIIHYLTRK